MWGRSISSTLRCCSWKKTNAWAEVRYLRRGPAEGKLTVVKQLNTVTLNPDVNEWIHVASKKICWTVFLHEGHFKPSSLVWVYLQFNFRDNLHKRIIPIQIPHMFVCLTGWIRYLNLKKEKKKARNLANKVNQNSQNRPNCAAGVPSADLFDIWLKWLNYFSSFLNLVTQI